MSFFFLRALTPLLSDRLKNSVVDDIYKQTKQSVIFSFSKSDGTTFFLETFFSNEECLLNFPEEQSRSRKAISILKEVRAMNVLSVEQAENERTFVIHLEQGWSLVFKWFGRQSNILLWNKGEVVWMLRNKLQNDLLYNASVWHQPRQWSEEEFIGKEDDLYQFIPQLGKEVITEWIKYSHWSELTHHEDKWLKVQALLIYLKDPTFYILQQNKRARLSLFYFKEEGSQVIAQEKNPLKAASLYFQAFYRYNRVEAMREKLAHYFNSRIMGLSRQSTQLAKRIEEFDESLPPQQLADLIMANLHLFVKDKEMEVFNFYTGETLLVKIKQGMSAADYAGVLYKKSKNRQAEKQNMADRLQQMKTLHGQFELELEALPLADTRTLLAWSEKYLPVSAESKKSKEKETPPEFKEYECQGFQILIGRNARNNDELTLHFAHKEDLWLHAKDVSGSHVIVKHKANGTFPKPVVERAAQLAAFYSKRKTDSLCPVMYTLKKYVRKVKGTAPGMVRVGKESVILVEPKD
ncbi:MAG TPA: NFACT RNA binding domain-containing protein [Cytophagaceae bacterium]|jgi:predicted ribosome quality control (RQC) complex YloA/Tae2 family protein|nr:NFACT RNA binding domain-containing protein [Cytophagaceae bacterium]